MPEPNLFGIFTKRLNEAGIRYVITGAVASVIYGEPRLTHDIDLVVEMAGKDVAKFLQLFPSADFYCPPMEVIKVELARPLRGHFNLVHHETGFKADVYLAGDDSLHKWAISERRQIQIEGDTLWVAPPEYVILRKLEYYREGKSEKHLRDIAGMLELSLNEIDLKQLEEFIHRYGLEREWQKAKEMTSIPCLAIAAWRRRKRPSK